MDSRKLVFKETTIVLAGQTVGVALMLGIYGLLGYFSTKVLLGSLVGLLAATGNFFFMAVTVSLAADKARQQDVNGGKKLLKGCYSIRMVVLVVILFACGKSGYFDMPAMVMPLVFVRPTLAVAELLRKGM